MKKAKFILVATLLLAVAGGALAFKAAKRTNLFAHYTTTAIGTYTTATPFCVRGLTYLTTVPIQPNLINTYYTTSPAVVQITLRAPNNQTITTLVPAECFSGLTYSTTVE